MSKGRIKGYISNIMNLDIDELSDLSSIIRDYIIEVVSKTGGHLASSLGAVDLAVVLHSLLKLPKDKLIWDVGHQAYAHKILTGRVDEFETLRQYGGISGFPNMSENPCDAFGVGHSSTSISAALGYAVANKQNKNKNKVVAIIGDGSISSGMPFEAMNQASHIKDLDITVILNDNEMSISPNVGALSKYFNLLRSDPIYYRLRNDVEYLISKIPAIGKNMISAIDRVSTGLKTVIDPGAFFLHLGWDYYGPVDGHNITELKNTIKKVMKIKGLKLIHVKTVKGKGYSFAEEKPSSFHGVGPFNIETGEIKKGKDASYTSIVGDHLVELGRINKDVNVITAAMPDGTGTVKFSQEFPDRFFDVGISEEHAPTFAAAMAIEGKIPFVCIYSTFMQRSIDQIIHDCALQNIKIVLMLDRAGVVGEDGGTHHGTFDLSYLRYIPGITIIAPRNDKELKAAMNFAVDHKGSVVAIRYPRGKVLIAEKEVQELKHGKAECLKSGNKIAVISNSYIVNNALEALKDTDFGVYDFKFVKPLDNKSLDEICENYEKIVVYEDNSKVGGLGSAVCEYIGEKGANVRVYLKGIKDDFVTHGNQNILREELGFSVEKIREFVLSL